MHWIRGPENPLPDPLTLLETLTDACAQYADTADEGELDHGSVAWPLSR